MKKILKLFLNTIWLVIVFCVTMGASTVVYSAISYQAKDSYAVISYKYKEDNVCYTDSIRFWSEDLSNGFTNVNERNTKLRVSNWLKFGWWKTAGSKVDMYFVDPIIKVVKPIFLPVACADEIKSYYGKTLYDFADQIKKDEKTDTLSTVLKIYDPNFIDGENGNYDPYKALELHKDEITLDNLSDEQLYEVAGNYNYFYQILFKLHKYNRTDKEGTPIYQNWYNKFVFEDNAGRHLKSSVYGLYVIEIISLVFALFFVRENRFTMSQKNENGETEISFPMLKNHKHHKLFKRKK